MNEKKLLVFSLLTLFSSFALALETRTSFQAQCEDSIPSTSTVVGAKQKGYSIDNSVSYFDLTRMGRAVPGEYVLGLTEMKSASGVSYKSNIIRDPSTGYECIAPQVTVSIYYNPMVVYIGNEFPVDSCSYKEILKHELRHVAAYQEHLPIAEETIKKAFSDAFQKKPLYGPIGQTNFILKNKISGGWMDFIKYQLNSVEIKHHEIDTADEYARISASCEGEVQKILKKYR
jgi:hypothetical protein